MGVNALQATKEMCQYSGWSISNLKLQKLLYLAHMIALGRSDGDCPLLDQFFEAWDYGPVVPVVYQEGKIFGNKPVGNVFHSVCSLEKGWAKDLIHESFNAFGCMSAGNLVAKTHWQGGAWYKHYCPGARGNLIPNEDILEEYKNRTAQA